MSIFEVLFVIVFKRQLLVLTFAQHNMATANLNKSEELVINNTTTASKYIAKRSRI